MNHDREIFKEIHQIKVIRPAAVANFPLTFTEMSHNIDIV